MPSIRWKFRIVGAVAAIALALTSLVGLSPAGASTTVRSEATGDIVATAQSAGQFTTLLAAAQAAGLVDALKAPGPLTVFAPTDAAFATLLANLHLTADQLLANKALLTAVLKYHVVSGKVLSTDLPVGTTTATTLAGGTIAIKKTAAGVTVNGYAHVTTADVLATNGVIHVIDSVLLPFGPKLDIVDTAKAAGSFTTLLAATQAAGLVDALEAPGPLTVFAPTDAAFARTLRRLHLTAAQLLAQPAKLATILKGHVVAGRITSAQLGRRTVATTLAGTRLVIRKTRRWVGRRHHRHLSTRITINGVATITTPDVLATNGVIHVINNVLVR